MYVDDCRIKGIVNLVLRDEQGRVKQHKTVRNAVTQYGLAHIIGRMIDPQEDIDAAHVMPRMMSHMAIGTGTTAASTYDRILEDEAGTRVQLMKDLSLQSEYDAFNVNFANGVDSLSQSFVGGAAGSAVIKTIASATNRTDLRVNMPITGQDVPPDTVIVSISTENGVTSVTLSNALDAWSGNEDFTFQYTNVNESISGTPAGYGLSGVDSELGASRGKVSGWYDPNDRAAPPFFGDEDEALLINPNFVQFGTSVDGIFQGSLNSVSGSITKDSGTTPEGYPTSENDYGVEENPQTNPALTPTAIAGTKKSGNRIVFVGTFKASNPTDVNTAVTEAGIFNKYTQDTGGVFDTTKSVNGTSVTTVTGGTVTANKAGYTGKGITQSMLCRTTFSVVNKASQDTLQITWSVQLSDTAN